jgi:ABC transport system ATP-binding/permease protein
MSEKILKALMQLFAIIARSDEDGTFVEGRKLVELFLKQQLNSELVLEYLKVFDEQLEKFQGGGDGEKKRKRTSSSSVKVLKICTDINAELEQRQKFIVVIRLLEFIFVNDEATEQELEFVETVALTFNVEEDEYKRLRDFSNPKNVDAKDIEQQLIINSSKTNDLQLSKHLSVDGLQGNLRILNLTSIGMYVLRLFGNAELFLNGTNVLPNRVYVLTHGSSLRSSKTQPIYYSDIISRYLKDNSNAGISFVADELEFKFKSGKTGLHTLNFAEESGKLIGIMGGSGAGKSTLLNVLNGNESPSSGAVLINNINLHTQKDKLEGVIGFVSQDDLLIEELTVFENLFFNAKLCFDGYSDVQITEIVHNTLNDLGLYETRGLKVGSPLEKTISGGQRKRLNIALELIREPAVMFVDEPTSGLSSRDSENIMDLLKELALKGKLIFVVIHQPSSDIFKMFDKLMILDVGGFPIYYANPVDAVSYFKHLANQVNADESECHTCGNVNPEQIFNIIETKVVDEYGNPTRKRKYKPSEWNEQYLTRPEFTNKNIKVETEPPQSTFKIPNFFNQLKVFITRDVKSKLTNTQYIAINMLEAPVLAILLGLIIRYFDIDVNNKVGYIFRENENMPVYLFMAVVVALFIGLTVSAEEIIRDRKILKRESFLNLSKGSYLLSKIMIMFALSAIQTSTFIIIGNAILGVHGMFWDYFLILFTTSCWANLLGLNISATFNSAVTIYILIPFLIIPQILLSGIVVKFEKLNPAITSQTTVPFVGDIITSRWAFEALAVNQFADNKFEKQFYKYDKLMSEAQFKKDYWIKEINKKIDKCENHLSLKNLPAEEYAADLLLLKNELTYETEGNSDVKFAKLDKIEVATFDKLIVLELHKLSADLSRYYMRQYNKASEQKDGVVYMLEKEAGGREAFQQLQDEFTNEGLSNMVKNSNDLNKVTEISGMLIQKADPVFKAPLRNTFLRTHFYAPEKRFFGTTLPTFWANILIIWLSSILLIVMLYFDVLKKLLDGAENLVAIITKKKQSDF